MENKNNKMSAPSAKLVRLGEGAYITVVMNNESLTLRQNDNPDSFDNALSALKEENWDALYRAMRPVKAFISNVNGVEIRDGFVYWNGQEVHSVISDRIMDFALKGLDHKPLCMFLNKLMANPSSRALNELYKFLEHKYLPITDNGNFIAYKGIGKDWYSITSGSINLIKGKVLNGRIYNGVGEEIECPRNAVDDNKEVACSYGLHAGSVEYAASFARSGQVVIVEINPKDVVSIPTDCSYQKLRTCAYKVVGVYESPITDALFESGWVSDSDDDYYDECDNDDSDYCDDCDIRDCSCDDVEAYLEPVHELVVAFDCPNSSWISYVEWFDNEELHVIKNDGGTIVYQEVPQQVAQDYANFVESDGSAGVFYNRKIKNQYTSYEK
jgi:KTSC domain